MLMCLFGVVLLKHYHKDRDFPFDFDENLTLTKWGWILGGTAVIYGISAFFASISTPTGAFESPINIPQFGYNINYFGSYQLPTFANDMLFNITLVAPAEEFCKLVTITAFFLFLKGYDWIPKEVRMLISVGVPVSFWAILHVYSNQAYINNSWFVVSAFCSGIMLVVVLWKTQSILAAILSHGFYNCLVIYLMATGLLVA